MVKSETNLGTCIECLDELKHDAQNTQKKGLPFIMASAVLWTLITAVQFLDLNINAKNLCSFMCSCLLIPLALIFSKIIRAEIFRKMINPINKLGFLCTMNQMLYILIAMWAFNRNPESMLMIYAMIFGAHLMPFSWIYDCKPYMIIAIIDTLGALVLGILMGNAAVAGFMIAMQIALCISIFINIRKEKESIES